MKLSDLQAVIEGIAPVIRDYVDQAVDARLAGRQPDTKAAAKPRLALKGEWQPGREYRQNDAVLLGSALFVAHVGHLPPDAAQPGQDAGLLWTPVVGRS